MDVYLYNFTDRCIHGGCKDGSCSESSGFGRMVSVS